MRRASLAAVDPGGILAEVESGPPLTIRQVQADDDATCALCLVGSAAGPLAGDDVRLRLAVSDGARATLTSAGASIVQGRPGGDPALVRTDIEVGARGRLRGRPPELVACAHSAVRVSVRLDLATDADVRWREIVALGRYGEPGGAARLSWRVDVGGEPVLRQDLDLPAGRVWPGLLAGRRVLATEFWWDRTPPGPAVALAPTVVAQPLPGGGWLLTALAEDLPEAQAALDALGERVSARAAE